MSETNKPEWKQHDKSHALPLRELVPWGYAPGDYMNKCHDCGDTYLDMDKRAMRCERCAMIARYKAAEAKLESLNYLTE
jgi:hypothetical protein